MKYIDKSLTFTFKDDSIYQQATAKDGLHLKREGGRRLAKNLSIHAGIKTDSRQQNSFEQQKPNTSFYNRIPRKTQSWFYFKGRTGHSQTEYQKQKFNGVKSESKESFERPTVSYYSVTSAPGSYYGENKLPGSYNEINAPIANDRETEAPESYNRETRAPLNSESRGTYQSRTPQSYYGKTREPNSYYAEMRATGSYYGEAREPGSYNRETRAPESYYGETKVPETYYSDTRTMRPYYSETRTPGYYYTRQETRPDPHPQSKKPSWLYSDSDQKVENNGYIDTWYQSYGNVNNHNSYPQPWIKHVAIWYKTTW